MGAGLQDGGDVLQAHRISGGLGGDDIGFVKLALLESGDFYTEFSFFDARSRLIRINHIHVRRLGGNHGTFRLEGKGLLTPGLLGNADFLGEGTVRYPKRVILGPYGLAFHKGGLGDLGEGNGEFLSGTLSGGGELFCLFFLAGCNCQGCDSCNQEIIDLFHGFLLFAV